MRGLLLLVIAFASGCTGCGLARDEGVKVVVPAMPTTLDWSTSDPTSWVNYPVMLATQRGLTALGANDEVRPALAERWERTLTPEGHERYVFHLRQDVRWSDGLTPLTAEDFVIGWRRALVGEERGELAELLGAGEVLRLQSEGAPAAAVTRALEKVAVRAVDPHTLEVVLDKPRSYFLARLATVYLFFPDPSGDLRGLSADAARAYFDRPRDGKPMSLGPFRVERWDRAGGRLTLALNSHSAFLVPTAPGEHLPERVTLLESEVGRALFDRERVGFVFIDRASSLAAGAPKDTVRQPLLSTFFVGLVTDRPPLDRVEIRQAIAWAIDRDALLSGLLPETRTSPTLLPSELPLSASATEQALLPHFELARARSLLAAGGGVKRPLRLVYQAGDSFIPTVAIAERLKRQLARLGIQVDAEPRADFYAELARRGPDGRHVVDLYLRRLGADYAHPHTFFTLFLPDGNHQTGWEALDGGAPMHRFESLLDEADASADPARARQLYVEAERLLVGDEAIIAPLFHPDRYYRVSPTLRGLGVDPFNFLSLSDLRVEASGP